MTNAGLVRLGSGIKILEVWSVGAESFLSVKNFKDLKMCFNAVSGSKKAQINLLALL
jgi:hypothetical protein